MKPSDDLVKEIYTGKDAQTLEEIAEMCGLSYSTVGNHSQNMVKSGKWKRVYVKRKGKRGVLQAYIKVK